MNFSKFLAAGAAATAWVFVSGSIWAQDDEASQTDAVDETSDSNAADDAAVESDEKGLGDAKDQKMLDPTEIDGEQEEESLDSPLEKPGETYLFVGLRYRGIVVPKFMMNLFGQGGTTVYVDSFGPELGVRKDNFEFVFSAWYADYGMEPTPFKATNDPEAAWELVESKLNVLYLTSDFMWTHPINPQFGVNYGMSGGFGLVWGDLIREQAYPSNGGYLPCRAPNDPNPAYCDNDNDHYDGYTEPSWSDGGSKPIIFPWLAFQTGVRYKPHRHLALRADVGFGITGFFFGLGADYGI